MRKSLQVLSAVLVVLLLVPGVRAHAEREIALYAAYLGVLAFSLSYILMPVTIWAGYRFGLLDYPDEARKTHAHATPLAGGSAVFLAFCLTILFNFQFSIEMKAVLCSSALIFIVGLLDDKWGLSAKVRLAVQVLAALILVLFGVHVTFIPDYLGGIYLETIITMLWIVGVTNSMNFIDGMDGLASGSCIIYSVFFALIALLTRQFYMMYLAVAIAGSCLGFFPFNFRPGKPARAFLGDGGSTFLGFLLASFAIMGEWGDSIVDLVVPVLVMSILIFDMCLTTIARIGSGEVKNFSEWLHYTGRDHFHHRLTSLGFTKARAAAVFFSVSVCFGLEALAILFSKTYISVLILIHSILVFAIMGSILVLGTGTHRASKQGDSEPVREGVGQAALPAGARHGHEPANNMA